MQCNLKLDDTESTARKKRTWSFTLDKETKALKEEPAKKEGQDTRPCQTLFLDIFVQQWDSSGRRSPHSGKPEGSLEGKLINALKPLTNEVATPVFMRKYNQPCSTVCIHYCTKNDERRVSGY